MSDSSGMSPSSAQRSSTAHSSRATELNEISRMYLSWLRKRFFPTVPPETLSGAMRSGAQLIKEEIARGSSGLSTVAASVEVARSGLADSGTESPSHSTSSAGSSQAKRTPSDDSVPKQRVMDYIAQMRAQHSQELEACRRDAVSQFQATRLDAERESRADTARRFGLERLARDCGEAGLDADFEQLLGDLDALHKLSAPPKEGWHSHAEGVLRDRFRQMLCNGAWIASGHYYRVIGLLRTYRNGRGGEPVTSRDVNEMAQMLATAMNREVLQGVGIAEAVQEGTSPDSDIHSFSIEDQGTSALDPMTFAIREPDKRMMLKAQLAPRRGGAR